jgi:hypothetical protein
VALAVRGSTGVPSFTVHSLDQAEYELGLGPPECLTQWNAVNLIEVADQIIALTDEKRDLIKDCARARTGVFGRWQRRCRHANGA